MKTIRRNGWISCAVLMACLLEPQISFAQSGASLPPARDGAGMRLSFEQSFAPSFTSNADDEAQNPKRAGFARLSQGLSVFAPLGDGVNAFGRLGWRIDHYGLRAYDSAELAGNVALSKRWDLFVATMSYGQTHDHSRLFAEHSETVQVFTGSMRAELKPAEGWSLTPALMLRRRWSQGPLTDTSGVQPSLAVGYSTCTLLVASQCWSAGFAARIRWSRYDQRFDGRQRIDRLTAGALDANYQFSADWRIGASVSLTINRSNRMDRSYRTFDATPLISLTRVLYP
jgi:hypothetical protein